MDTINKICQEIAENCQKYVDLCLKDNKDFHKFNDAQRVIIESLCKAILISWEILKLSNKISGIDFFKE